MNRERSRERETRVNAHQVRLQRLEHFAAAQMHVARDGQDRALEELRAKRHGLEQLQQVLEAELDNWRLRVEEEERRAPSVPVLEARLRAEQEAVRYESDRLKVAQQKLQHEWATLRSERQELERVRAQMRQEEVDIARERRELENVRHALEHDANTRNSDGTSRSGSSNPISAALRNCFCYQPV